MLHKETVEGNILGLIKRLLNIILKDLAPQLGKASPMRMPVVPLPQYSQL